MKLTIENVAKIKRANILIDGITVLAGENNTGKSTIGKILYCIYSSFNNLENKMLMERKRGVFRTLFRHVYASSDELVPYWDLSEEILRLDNKDDLKKLLSSKKIDINEDSVLADILKYMNFDSKQLERLVVREQFESEFKEQFLPIDILDNLYSEINLQIKDQNIKLKFSKKETIIESKIKLYKKGIYIDNPFLLDKIEKTNSKQILNDMNLFGYLLTTNAESHEEYMRNILSSTLKENEGSLIDSALNKERMEVFLNIIKKTIGGDFYEKEDKFIFLENNQFELELSNLSTGIKSFAILLKLLENNEIDEKSIIILDEPEVHLHPKWQLKYAEILVLLQKEFNLNIVLTCHSPYFINAVEVYAAKYCIADKCKYYLADIDDDNKAFFEDVTTNTEKIYKKLAEPLRYLNELMYEI